VTLLARPEWLHLNAAAPHAAEATVMWREYYGHDQRVGLRLLDGTMLVVRAGTDTVYAEGDAVTVSAAAPLRPFLASTAALSR
jgi:hypothetical protein